MATELECVQCGRQITHNGPACPQCGHEIPPEQRERLQALAPRGLQRRVYIYGRRKERLSRETRVLLTLVLILVIVLLVCRVTHGGAVRGGAPPPVQQVARQ